MSELSSDKIKNAIVGALNEERAPKSIRYLKIALLASALSSSFALVLWFNWPSDLNSIILGVGILLLILFTVGFVLYFYPQPRISIPGFWMPWMWGRILIFMGILSTLQLLLCPDLAGILNVESRLPWLTQFTHLFMDLGGMRVCMFLCGVLFSGISASIVLLSFKKSVEGSRLRSILGVAALVLVGQLPVIYCQVMSRTDHLIYWLAGSFISILALAFLIRANFRKV